MNHLTVEVQCLLIKILPFLLVVSLRKHLFMRAEETYLMISHGGGVIFKNGVLGCLLCCYIPIFSKVKSKDLSQLADSSQQWWLKMYHVWISQFRSVKVAIGLLGFVLASTTIVLSSSEVWLWSHCPPFETYRWLFHNFLCKELWPASMPPRASWWIICPNSLWTQGEFRKTNWKPVLVNPIALPSASSWGTSGSGKHARRFLSQTPGCRASVFCSELFLHCIQDSSFICMSFGFFSSKLNVNHLVLSPPSFCIPLVTFLCYASNTIPKQMCYNCTGHMLRNSNKKSTLPPHICEGQVPRNFRESNSVEKSLSWRGGGQADSSTVKCFVLTLCL